MLLKLTAHAASDYLLDLLPKKSAVRIGSINFLPLLLGGVPDAVLLFQPLYCSMFYL